jgi:hypothetical protein
MRPHSVVAWLTIPPSMQGRAIFDQTAAGVRAAETLPDGTSVLTLELAVLTAHLSLKQEGLILSHCFEDCGGAWEFAHLELDPRVFCAALPHPFLGVPDHVPAFAGVSAPPPPTSLVRTGSVGGAVQ